METVRSEAAFALVAVLLGGLSAFQLALVLGAPWGRAAWGGGQDVLSPMLRAGSAFAIVTYGAIAWLLRWRMRSPASRPFRIAAWVIVGYFALGVLLNLASSSAWERFLMAPIALLLGLGSAAIARGDARRT